MAQQLTSRAVILIKALPQPSRRHGKTVCCAGVTSDRHWKRLFPVRFRHLSSASSFNRWDWIQYDYRRPTNDPRSESCHVFEESIAAAQTSILDNQLAELEPSPFEFRFQFEDDSGKHIHPLSCFTSTIVKRAGAGYSMIGHSKKCTGWDLNMIANCTIAANTNTSTAAGPPIASYG
jgi:hypothetical protein